MTYFTLKKYLTSFLILVVAAFLLAGASHAESGSEGKEFYLAFQPNFEGSQDLSLTISGENDTQGTIDIVGLNWSTTFTVVANRPTTIVIPAPAAIQPWNAVSKLVVHVVSQKNVTVYGLNRQTRTTDGFLALPVDALGTEYYGLSYLGYGSAQLSVIGAYDNTRVTMTPSSASGVAPFVITLQRGESYMMPASGDISGSHISASAPIAVMAGADATHIPAGYGYLDHIVETLPPVSTWGKSFLSVPLATRLKGDLFRVLASQDGTQVSVNGVLKATLEKGKFYETMLTVRSQITASAPVLLMQFAVGSDFDGVDADPFSMTIPPTEQFLDHYTFSTPAADLGFSRQFVNVVIPTGAIGELRMDGLAVDASLFSPIGNSGFSGGQVPASPGSHTIRSVNPVPFGIYVYGFGYHDSYGYPGGMAFKAINPTGDPFAPGLRLIPNGDVVQGAASDSEDADANGLLDAAQDANANGVIDRRNEDVNGNGRLDPGEDTNANAVLDRDTGLFKVELLAGATNLQLNVLPFVPGAIAVQFTVSRIDTTKPGVGRVLVQDGAGNKAEAPVEIGTVTVLQDVRAVITLSTRDIAVDTASFKKPPFSITDGTDKKMIEWRFDTFKADSVADLGFDVILSKPIAGERRVVSHRLDLYYKDASGNEVHTALDERSVAVLPGNYVVTPSTDKATYVAGESIFINSAVSNVSTLKGWFGVRLSLTDASSGQSTLLATLPNQLIDANASVSYDAFHLPATSVQVGTYKVLAELLDSDANVAGIGSTGFAVRASAGPGVSATLTTDKQSYGPHETVLLNARLNSLRANEALNGLNATTTVRNADNSIRMSKTEIVAQLSSGGLREFRYSLPLAFAVPGPQSGTLVVTSADGTKLAQAVTSYTVASTADTGAGLIGAVSMASPYLHAGQNVAFAFTVSNTGNAALVNAPLTFALIDPIANKVVAEFPYVAGLPVGATYKGSAQWLAPVTDGANYVVVLSATVGGKKRTLAQTTITVLKLDISQALVTGSRVLVLVPCAAQGAECDTQRSGPIGRTLTALGVNHTIVNNEASFRQSLRSGLYNTLWLSGKQDKLHGALAGEVRELVFGGSGLIVDGAHDERNKELDAVTGIIYRGKHGESGLPVALSGPLFEPQHLTTTGRSLKILLGTGTRSALFEGAGPQSDGPAIVSNGFGSGRTAFFAFDLALSLEPQVQWGAIVERSLRRVLLPATAAAVPGAPVSVKTSVTNRGPATGVRVVSVLPVGARLLAASPEPVLDERANSAQWNFDLAPQQSVEMMLTLAAPPLAGDFALQSTFATVNDDVKLYGAPREVAFTVMSATKLGAQVNQALQSLPVSTPQQRKARDSALANLRAALAAMEQVSAAGYESAIVALVRAAEDCRAIGGLDTRSAAQGIGAVLRVAQARWSIAVAAEH